MKPITDILKDYFRDNGIVQKKLAERIGEASDSGFSQKLKNKDLDTDLIYRISIDLQYDFFAEMSKEMMKENKNIKSILKNNNQTTTAFDDAIVEVMVNRFPNVFK